MRDCLACIGRSGHSAINARRSSQRTVFSLKWDTDGTLGLLIAVSLQREADCSSPLSSTFKKQKLLIDHDQQLFSWAFRCESLVSKSSISFCNWGHGFVSDFQRMTCGVSLSTILASCVRSVRVLIGKLGQVWSHSEPLTLGRKLSCDRGFRHLRDQACERGSGPKVLPLWIYTRTAFRLSYRFSELISRWQSVWGGLRHLDAFKANPACKSCKDWTVPRIRTGSETTGAVQIVWRVLPYETITLKCCR